MILPVHLPAHALVTPGGRLAIKHLRLFLMRDVFFLVSKQSVCVFFSLSKLICVPEKLRNWTGSIQNEPKRLPERYNTQTSFPLLEGLAVARFSDYVLVAHLSGFVLKDN